MLNTCILVDDLKKNSFKSLFCLRTKALGVQDLESKVSLFSLSRSIHMQTKLFIDL